MDAVSDAGSGAGWAGGWLAKRLWRHGGTADAVRQNLAPERRLVVSPRTVQRAVAPCRRQLLAKERVTVRFEMPPDHQLKTSESCALLIAGESGRVFLFVATLG